MPEINFMPAYVRENRLYCRYFLPDEGIKVPVDDVDFPEQCIQAFNICLSAYLRSGEYELALRFDGTGCLVQRGFMRRSFSFDWKTKPFISFYKGTVKGPLNIDYAVNNVVVEGRHAVASTAQLPGTLYFDDYRHSRFYMSDNAMLPVLYKNVAKHKLCYLDGDAVVEAEQFWCEGFTVVGGNNIDEVKMSVKGQ